VKRRVCADSGLIQQSSWIRTRRGSQTSPPVLLILHSHAQPACSGIDAWGTSQSPEVHWSEG